jgi:hypothetical protein
LVGGPVLHDRLKTARVGRPSRRRNESILRSQATSSPEGVGKGQDTVVDLHHVREGHHDRTDRGDVVHVPGRQTPQCVCVCMIPSLGSAGLNCL